MEDQHPLGLEGMSSCRAHLIFLGCEENTNRALRKCCSKICTMRLWHVLPPGMCIMQFCVLSVVSLCVFGQFFAVRASCALNALGPSIILSAATWQNQANVHLQGLKE